MKLFLYLFSCMAIISCQKKKSNASIDFTTTFEKSKGTETGTYDEVINFYEQLAKEYTSIAIYEMGLTDSGKPLHLVTFNPNRSFDSEFSGKRDKNVLLINNGIHPGESDGVDATMMLIRDLAQGIIQSPKNTIIAVIPIYNIGGSLNRNSTSRTNQNGPNEYGFRGNARNYDLNRDFIKADTKNARSFIKLFQTVKPDLFIDNHVSNGADYQYVLTHLFTQHNKLGGELGDWIENSLRPQLEDSLHIKQWDITPYVNVFNEVPETGFIQFMDSPRYSTGYTTLFNTMGMMVETHMLKPYKQRVEGTYELMKTFINIADSQAVEIKKLREDSFKNYKPGTTYALNWKVDSTKATQISFLGYKGEMVPSQITGAQRLKFNHSEPFTKPVTYYNNFKPSDEVTIPESYIIPQGWWPVLDLLKINGIKMKAFEKDTVITATVYKIEDYKTYTEPFEGHYPHYNTVVETSKERVMFRKGDFIISTNQHGVRYLLETLEPAAVDSFFNWNFFDTILQEKEGFSPYVWEDMAAKILVENPSLKYGFETKKKHDKEFADNWYAQLDWLYKHSDHYEKSHLRYPVVRVRG